MISPNKLKQINCENKHPQVLTNSFRIHFHEAKVHVRLQTIYLQVEYFTHANVKLNDNDLVPLVQFHFQREGKKGNV